MWLWTIPATTLGLGIWQTYRLQWKLDLIEKSENSLVQSPVPIQPGLPQFTRVEATGSFIHGQEMLVGLRQRRTNDPSQMMGGGVSKVGYLVFTPFQTPTMKFLVNRGWIPKENKDDKKRWVTGTLNIQGIIREGEPDGLVRIPNQPEKGQWYTIQLNEMAQHTQSSPLLMEMTEKDNPSAPHLPLMRLTGIELPNNHLSYALTWFSLSAISSIMLLRRGRFRK